MHVVRLIPLALVGSLACRPSPEPTVAPTTASSDPAPGVPDNALALVDGNAVSRASFDDALAKRVGGGPSSRDDRGLRQHVVTALVTREMVRLELAKLGVASGDITGRSLPLLAALAQIPTPRGDASKPSWFAVPPLVDDDLAHAIVVASELAETDIPDAEVTAEYERQQGRWSSDAPWLRLDILSVAYSDATGVAACDDYVAKYRRCSEKFPTATRPTVLAELGRQAAAWREQGEDPERKLAASTECEAASTEAMQQTTAMGCDWASSADADERKARNARRDQLAASVASARTRLAAGEDPLAVAAELGGRVELRRMVAADELAKPVAKATRSAKPGSLSKAIDDGRAWTLVRVVERQPAGTLTIDAVKDDLVTELRTRKLAESFEGLPALLLARHAVELHSDFEALDATPDGAGL
jgi:parvulin-like peptidyl-prolyl cis-trans isomerase-like protein